MKEQPFVDYPPYEPPDFGVGNRRYLQRDPDPPVWNLRLTHDITIFCQGCAFFLHKTIVARQTRYFYERWFNPATSQQTANEKEIAWHAYPVAMVERGLKFFYGFPLHSDDATQEEDRAFMDRALQLFAYAQFLKSWKLRDLVHEHLFDIAQRGGMPTMTLVNGSYILQNEAVRSTVMGMARHRARDIFNSDEWRQFMAGHAAFTADFAHIIDFLKFVPLPGPNDMDYEAPDPGAPSVYTEGLASTFDTAVALNAQATWPTVNTPGTPSRESSKIVHRPSPHGSPQSPPSRRSQGSAASPGHIPSISSVLNAAAPTFESRDPVGQQGPTAASPGGQVHRSPSASGPQSPTSAQAPPTGISRDPPSSPVGPPAKRSKVQDGSSTSTSADGGATGGGNAPAVSPVSSPPPANTNLGGRGAPRGSTRGRGAHNRGGRGT